MDINFHYFAVKTIARFAGFSENEAQRIAGYSQFVDDYNPFLNYTFETIPDFMLGETALVSKSDGGYTLKTIQTGFPQTIDYALYSRSNTRTFLYAARQIYTYLYQLKNNDRTATFICSCSSGETRNPTVMQRKRLCLSRFLADIINTSPYLIGQPLRAELSGTDGHIGK